MNRLLIILVTVIAAFNAAAQTYNPTTVYTRKLTSLQGELLTSSDFTSAQKASIKSQTLAQHPNATFLADATQTYNCHGYAWHLTEGNSVVVWINQYDRNGNPNVYKYWTDGSFIQVCNEADADKIHYYNGDHSAVYSVVINGKYESKWGQNIRIRHDPTDVPSIYNAQYRAYYATTKVSGSTSNLCTGTRTFSVKNIPGATYTWTKSSNLSVVGASNAYQYTVQRYLGSGAAWVQVQITTSCSGTSATSSLNFTVGAPTTPGTITWTWNAGPNRVLLDVADVPGATSYKWYLDGVLKGTTTTSDYMLPMTGNVSCGNFYYFGVKAANSCGTSAESYVGATMPPCGSGFTVSPNPSSDKMLITSDNSMLSKSNKKQTAEILAVEIIDKMGTLKYKQKFPKGMTSVNISVSSLPADVYALRIFDGQNWQSTKIVVKR